MEWMEVEVKLVNIQEEYAIYGMVFSLCNRIQTLGDREFKDITLKQQFLMIALEMFHHPATLKEMSELIGCSYQNVKRMAEHLRKEGYLTMQQDEMDKRKVLLSSTGKMEKLADESRNKIEKFMKNLYHGITKEELNITLSTLKKMDQNIGGIIE
jgi:DNA-binding MarR family transcriptional regulator